MDVCSMNESVTQQMDEVWMGGQNSFLKTQLALCLSFLKSSLHPDSILSTHLPPTSPRTPALKPSLGWTQGTWR